MEIIFQDKTLDEDLEMYDILKEIDDTKELFVYDITEWRLLFPQIPNEWYVEDLSNGNGYYYYFSDEMMIASTIKQPSIRLYMHVKYTK